MLQVGHQREHEQDGSIAPFGSLRLLQHGRLFPAPRCRLLIGHGKRPTMPRQPGPKTNVSVNQCPRARMRRPGAKHSQTPAALNAPLTVLQGVGPKNAATLEELGLRTLGDMLYYYPNRYEDYSQLKPIKSIWYGEQLTVIGTIQSVTTRPIRNGASTIVEAVLSDSTGTLRLSWFNQPWLANRLREGQQISVSGKVDQYLGRLVMSSPDWEPVEAEHLNTNRIVPIYPLTARITQKWLRGLIHQVVTYWAPAVVDPLPENVRGLCAGDTGGAGAFACTFSRYAGAIEGGARTSGVR